MNVIRICLIVPLLFTPLFAQIYVAQDGNDANPGTLDLPFITIPKAVSISVPGDTIFIRGGLHLLGSTINITKNGAVDKPIHLFAYAGENVLLDFSTTTSGAKGISLKASFWHIRGLNIKGAGDNGLEISGGSFNRIERCSFYENRDTGLQLSNGAAHNRILGCDSFYNADPPDYADADGFAPKLTVGTGNFFSGCRAWGNCDDGWDGYMRGATNVTTTLENCWTWGNGYLKNGTDPGSQANGNGFKMGGGDNSNRDSLMHHFILSNCLAFDNKYKGFDQNNNVGSMTLINCTGIGNLAANYRILKPLKTGQTLRVFNCISLNGKAELAGFAFQATNSWHPPFVTTADDFISIDPSRASAPRKPDGSLPDIEFMHLRSGSDLIDSGTEAGLLFTGTAPDLGAFETTPPAVVQTFAPATFHPLLQNYPNPFNPATVIYYQLEKSDHVRLSIFNSNGQLLETLIDEVQSLGEHCIRWQPRNLAVGIYLYILKTSEQREIRRVSYIK